MPQTLPSVAFNPFEGVDKANIHYIFKAMTSVPPWELQKEQLVIPTALTLLMIEVSSKLFPDPIVFRFHLLVSEFINRWTLPKFRPEWSDAELQYEIARYQRDMEDLEERFKKAYADLSVYFGSFEKPEKDPIKKKINETHTRTKSISEKVCGKEPNASFVAQEKALAIWNEYRNSPEVKRKYGKKDHRITYADVFDYCKRAIVALGFKTGASFEKAVRAAKKRQTAKNK